MTYAPWWTCSLKRRLKSWSKLLPHDTCDEFVKNTNWRSHHTSRFRMEHPKTWGLCCIYSSRTQKVFPPPSDKRMTVHSTHCMWTSGCGWEPPPPLRVWWPDSAFCSCLVRLANGVGAHMLICIYAQCQSKYISVFSSILFLYYFYFTVRTSFQFFPNFSLFFLPFYSLQKPVILTRHC